MKPKPRSLVDVDRMLSILSWVSFRKLDQVEKFKVGVFSVLYSNRYLSLNFFIDKIVKYKPIYITSAKVCAFPDNPQSTS